jgi:hypothetical protein
MTNLLSFLIYFAFIAFASYEIIVVNSEKLKYKYREGS